MSENLKYLSVRFQTTNKTYTFSTEDSTIKQGDGVVVETQRGIEYVKVIAEPFDTPNVSFEIKPIIRKATKEDEEDYKQNIEDCKEAKEKCQKEADKLNLQMNIISAEYTLDRAKITFIYVADDRIDFRELLKVLAAIFRCRIDLRQVGTRDKAKMVSGVGPCGRELCCATYLKEFDRISINMAKNQLLALNVQKLSGQCGNLMCCLKYEDEAYKDLRKGLPKMGSYIEYDKEKLKLTSMNIIARTCKLENKEHAIFISLEELMEKGKVLKPQGKEKPAEAEEGSESVSE